ncbi:hypothetical protein [Vagococcus jeotgali]|uniref:hypothetical protein n=1 Tax=Vagococcus jeotgali TaxID=3109030 RepID=UPI002DD9A362|nr:hypothetical protein [Vagococcus sp. B2T-5]
MHTAMVNIILDRIQDQYVSEELFCHDVLDLSIDKWTDWKSGNKPLPTDKMQKIKGLFSDYEWMLIQKIISQTLVFPEKRNFAVMEYKHLKSVIATTWIKSGIAKVELIAEQRFSSEDILTTSQKRVINLRIIMSYDEWGYDDILEFFMPSVVQQQIEESKVDLLEWLDENLVNTYTDKSGNSEENE